VRKLLVPSILSIAACGLGSSSYARDLTFDERLRAQGALERVYFAHQVGAAVWTVAR
jgi:hypothetical protein